TSLPLTGTPASSSSRTTADIPAPPAARTWTAPRSATSTRGARTSKRGLRGTGGRDSATTAALLPGGRHHVGESLVGVPVPDGGRGVGHRVETGGVPQERHDLGGDPAGVDGRVLVDEHSPGLDDARGVEPQLAVAACQREVAVRTPEG